MRTDTSTDVGITTGPLAASRTTEPSRTRRVLFLLPAGLSLLAGLNAALTLAGVTAPVSQPQWSQVHGVVMVLGFLATLIALERSVALRQRWAYAAPMLLGAGGVSLLAPTTATLGRWLLVAGTSTSTVVLVGLWRRQRDDATATQILAGVHAVCASLMWVRLDIATVLPWLVAFIVLTVCAERVELARICMPHWAAAALLAFATAVLSACIAALLWPTQGTRLVGLSFLALVIWLAPSDVARCTIRLQGLPRYSAVAILAAYGWLVIASVTWLAGGPAVTRAAYDTVVHAAFLGFAVSMVMAHAPIILPAVLRSPLPYHWAMWIPLGVLHIGLVLRIVAGNVLGHADLWRTGAILGVVALLIFVLTALVSALTARHRGGAHE